MKVIGVSICRGCPHERWGWKAIYGGNYCSCNLPDGPGNIKNPNIIDPDCPLRDDPTAKLAEALQCLVDAQNGPPLLGERHEKFWNGAMDKAKAVLAEVSDANLA